MIFVIHGIDGNDAGALDRRLAVRNLHLATAAQLKAEGKLHYALATLDETGRMSGSIMVVDFPDRAAVDAWLAVEPYVTGGVWLTVTVTAGRIAPLFAPA